MSKFTKSTNNSKPQFVPVLITGIIGLFVLLSTLLITNIAHGASPHAPIGDFINNDLSNKSGIAWGWATYRDFTSFNFSNSNFGGSDFGYSNLTNTNLTSTVNVSGGFSHEIATGAKFIGANINSSVLNDTDFSGADFSQANISSTVVSRAKFINVNFTNANLKGATGFASADVTGAIWSNTTCPDGTNSNNDGNTCVGHF